MATDNQPERESGPVYLIGGGVVGQAIAEAHLSARCAVFLSDLDEQRLDHVCQCLAQRQPGIQVTTVGPLGGKLPTREIHVVPADAPQAQAAADQPATAPVGAAVPESSLPPLAIESIFENRDAKRSLLSDLQAWLGPAAVICSNTSTLPVGGLVDHLSHPQQCCGMHFFMPVEVRDLVEIVVPITAASQTIARAKQHAESIGKPCLEVADTPGFVVNRMLSPYLNESLRLLCQGVPAEQLERVVVQFGMPFSPLELIDWIGPRTAFDAGRVYWRAFPKRLEPAPLLPGMVKAKLTGRSGGKGFYDYQDAGHHRPRGQRSNSLSNEALAVVKRYEREVKSWSDDEVRWQLFLPMLIEAHLILRAGVVGKIADIDTAMRGGLGFADDCGFLGVFERCGTDRLVEELHRRADQASFSAAEPLREQLENGTFFQANV